MSKPYDGAIDIPRLMGAVHSEAGFVEGQLGIESAQRVTLAAGEQLDLVFDASELPKLARGYQREYIFVTTGKYEEPGQTETASTNRGFALDANAPNPFNPVTTITYNLPVQTQVNLIVYDVSGALVRTLVSGVQAAGEKSISWDGRSNSGNPMLSRWDR